MRKKIKPHAKTHLKSAPSEPKLLTALEVAQMDHYSLLKEYRRKERECVSARQATVEDKKAIAQLSIRCFESDAEKLAEEMKAVEKRSLQDKEKQEALLSGIRERLGLTGRFGFNPDTLEVIQG